MTITRPAPEHSDATLMGLVQSGDPEALGRLYDRYQVRAYALARWVCRDPHRAEDAVQEAFLAVWRGRGGYQPERGSVHAWTMKIVYHRALDETRRQGRHERSRSDQELEHHPDLAAPSQHDALERAEQAQALQRSMGLLPAAQAQVIGLAFFGGLTHQEIAQQLSLPPGTVKGRMRLGLEKLRGLIAETQR